MAKILIVDDEPLNRELLHAYLEGAGHELYDADSGESALLLAAQLHPDLVLLDVMLPGLSGFETAERLKSTHRNEFLPIILVTALADHGSRLRGLRAGADEFLSKPVERHELLLRCANLLALRQKEMTLVQRHVELVELQRFRDEMTTMIIHDLKNPLSVIMANVEYVMQSGGSNEEETVAAMRDSREAGQRAVRLLANLLDVARMETGQLRLKRSRLPVAGLIDPLVKERSHLADSRGITLQTSIARGAEVNADVDLITRVVENMFDNAFRHTPPGGRISVAGRAEDTRMQLRIGNSGAPIPADARDRIFEKYGQAQPGIGRMNLGLGLYFCRLAAEAHGGRIWVEETIELPTVFGIELPINGDAHG
jgi:two-component system, sensor histidine kinase and response regulator